MILSFSEEQEAFRDHLRRFFTDHSPTDAVRRLMEDETGYDTHVWQTLSTDLGVTALHIPEAYGGAGFGIVELAIACEEMGRALLCSPYFASIVLAATAILKAGTEQQKETYLPRLANGTHKSTLAYSESNGSWAKASISTAAKPLGDRYELHGSKSFVPDAHLADFVVIAAKPDGEADPCLFLVQKDAPGMVIRSLEVMDRTRKLGIVELDGTPAERLGDAANAGALDQTLAIAATCLANEMVGGADRLREDALAYAQMRVQFGRPIASFQSLKHKAADMLMDVELAKSGAYYAAAALDCNDAEANAMASLAKAQAGDAYMQTAIHAVQIHGGIGFTWENDTHLWFKRAKSSSVFLGDSNHHRELLMQAWA